MTTVRIPLVLRDSTEGNRAVDVAGGTVAEALDDLFAKHPPLRERVAATGACRSSSTCT